MPAVVEPCSLALCGDLAHLPSGNLAHLPSGVLAHLLCGDLVHLLCGNLAHLLGGDLVHLLRGNLDHLLTGDPQLEDLQVQDLHSQSPTCSIHNAQRGFSLSIMDEKG